MTNDDADMTCRELVELVTAYLDGALPPADRARFERHLRECDGCDAYLEQMRETVRLLATLSAESAPAGAARRLLDAFRSWKTRPA